jgi:hypothetical protein
VPSAGQERTGTPRDHLTVHIFFDESGDYAFRVDRFDCYVQAAVICPESALPGATAFVQDRCTAWDLTELHAHQMSADQLHEVAEFLATSSICQRSPNNAGGCASKNVGVSSA